MSDNDTGEKGIKAAECDWNLDFADKKEGNPNAKKNKKFENTKMEWMSFKEKGDYKVRLVGKAIHCLKYSFVPFGKSRVITHPSYFKEDPAYLAGFYPSDTFAIHVIDRADGKLKILEKGKPLFKAFNDYIRITGTNPAGKEGPDFVITVDWPKDNKLKTKYTAMALPKLAPLTAEEIAVIRATFTESDKERAKADGLEKDLLFHRLQHLYKTTDIKKIKELWDALPESAKVPKDRDEDNAETPKTAAPKVQPKIEEPKVEEPVTGSGDKLFDEDNGEAPF